MFVIQTDVITFDLYYGGKSAVEVLNDGDEAKSQKVQKFKVDETTPCFRNIDINHVICRTARRAAYFNGLSQKVQKFKVDETTPCFRNIDINHVICRTARRAAYFNGLPEMPVSNIHIRDMEVNNAEYGIVINRTDGVKCR